MKFTPSTARLSAFTVLIASVAFVACTTTVPETGRKQVNFMDPAEEAALGFSEFKKMKAEKPISGDAGLNAQVQRVGKRLSAVMPVPNAEWEFVVFDDPTPNAFALPGGKVGVHTGIFQLTKNDAGLAAVIGHEVAHVVARHSGERMSQSVVSGVLVAGAGYALNRDGGNGIIPTAALGAGALIATRSFSRKQELEADRMGAIFMARAGYDPKESIGLWQRFAAWRSANNSGSSGPQFLSTHPLDEKRISELQQYMPEALTEYRPQR
ncbi:MAG: M48 family metallopeptidase [Verrucomicrobiales bacterium]|nr:M48 family metallopeptidase [Verrucomicrobiales bacterium]